MRSRAKLTVHVLIVEDDPRVARLIGRMLPPDFSSEHVATKRAALRALGDSTHTYRLALIDVALGLDCTAGLEVLEVAAKSRGLVRALVTASKSRAITNHAVSCRAFLVGKPFGRAQLAPLIEDARALADPLSASVLRRSSAWSLSARQAQILGLLAAGRPRDEIPRELGMSTDTFRSHVREVLSRSDHGRLDDVLIGLLRDAIAELTGR